MPAKTSRVPAATISRLSLYARALENLDTDGAEVVSSETLAEMCQVNPAQVRKDLAYFGEFGVRGVGYYVGELLFEIRKILGLNRTWNMAIVGMGNLGTALVAHDSFARAGYYFVAAFDNDQEKIGLRLASGLIIEPASRVVEVCQAAEAEIGVITTPPSRAQDVLNQMVKTSIRAVLNFAPIQLDAPEGFLVENVDFTVKLDNLAYHLTSR